MRPNLRGDRVEIRPLAGFEFGVDEFTVDANFEGTAAGRDQPGSHARCLTNASRQTGGFRFVVSDRAVFDRYFRFHARLLYLCYAMRPRRRCRALSLFPRKRESRPRFQWNEKIPRAQHRGDVMAYREL